MPRRVSVFLSRYFCTSGDFSVNCATWLVGLVHQTICIRFKSLDASRFVIFGGIWHLLAGLLERLVNWALPVEMRVYSTPVPFYDFGDKIELGICAFFEGESKTKPAHFVCNVGYIPCTDDFEAWTEDLLHTAHATQKILQEFVAADREDLGLVSNLLCIVPKFKRGGLFGSPSAFKEVNLSAWKSDSHAHRWYVQSPAHRHVLKQHSNRELSMFGNTLASLTPKCPIRWQGRCSGCAALVEGYPENYTCSACGASAHHMPLF